MPTSQRTVNPWYHYTTLFVMCICCMLMTREVYSQTTIFQANFENSSGDNAWTYNGGATDGNWIRGVPNPYNTGSTVMEIAAFQGTNDLLTGILNSQDVDGGPTTARSPVISIPSGTTTINFQYYFSYYINSTSADYLSIELRDQATNATLVTLVSELGAVTGKNAVWTSFFQDISSLAGQNIYVYVASADLATGSKVEAAVDLIELVNIPAAMGGSTVCTTIISDDFEAGMGNWDDPGSDCERINDASSASNGSFSLRLRDDSNTSMTTSVNLDLSIADTVRVDFSYLTVSMDTEEDFWLQMSTNGGTSFTTIATWISGTDFVNNTRYYEQINIPGPLTSNTRFRFVCDASNNGDEVYLDEIVISSCAASINPCPVVELTDTIVYKPEILMIDANPQSTQPIIDHQWTDLGTGSASGYTLLNTDSQSVSLFTAGSLIGTVVLKYEATTASCTVADTLIIQIYKPDNCTDIFSDDFEVGMGNWDDPGSDCERIDDPAMASNGSFSLRLRDDSNSSMSSTVSIDLSSADTVKIDFSYLAVSMENGEDFWLQISTNGGSTYNTIAAWVSGTHFNNDTRYYEEVIVVGPLTNNTRFRFVCDASDNGDEVYLDEIFISSCIAEPVNCPTVNLIDTIVCRPDLITLDGDPQGDGLTYTSHLWTDLGTGTSSGYTLSNTSSQVASLNASGASPGTVRLSYKVSTSDCMVTDTIVVQILSDPICMILTESDTICSNTSLQISAFTHYMLNPDSGLVVPAGSGSGFTQIHEIIGVQDPASTKVIITMPTWDDHFDTILLNGQMIIPEIFETASYDANGMNCLTPWNANINGLPRSIIEITNTQVRYFSSLTTTSTFMTEVFPSNWTTTPQPFLEGTNYLQFGIQNTAGPVSGSWYVEAIGTVGYSYLWSTGETTAEITVSPGSTTTYHLTVTSPTGCVTECEKTIYVGTSVVDSVTYEGCSGDGYGIVINGTQYNESNPSDTILLMNESGCDSTIYVRLTFDDPPVVDAGSSPSPLCSNAILTLADLNPVITGGINTGKWTSSGGGVFDNGGLFGGPNPATTYTPGQLEINAGKLILTLTSDDPPSSCEPDADAVLVLISDIRCSNFPWTGNN